MKLREFAEVADGFFTSSNYSVYVCDESGFSREVYHPDYERASVEALFDCEVASINTSAYRNIGVDVVANNDDQKLEQLMHDIMKECDEFLSYLESFKR